MHFKLPLLPLVRIASHNYPAEDIPFPALVLCANTPPDKLQVGAEELDKVNMDKKVNLHAFYR